ncbi:MAG: hypothetical protein EOP08_15065 [Proteobacteria bacterium]|nr:MAG: hypothetical protein EOP08_15065 [Pseudomonadota bacterium]
MKREHVGGLSVLGALVLALVLGPAAGCSTSRSLEGVRVSEVPVELRDNYELFAQRCSKCHGLSRALNAGDKSDAFWQRYVTRMRRQPGSGIAPEDEPPILAFLHYYSARVRGAESTGSTK